ncbi:MAG: hypothetical protein L0Y56_03660 [Nitrospira sp.]|nr:hypothetical protein [Nitrospira sp.]
MANTRLVQEFMSPIVQLDADTTIADALKKLEQAHVTFGAVRSAEGNWLGVLTVEQLRAANPNNSLQTLIRTAQHPIVVEPTDTLDNVVQTLSKDLALRLDLAGILVQEKGLPKGILPRKLIVEQASQMVERKSIYRMEGAPLTNLLYECPEDQERQIVEYYDPKSPPRCSKGHSMKPVYD